MKKTELAKHLGLKILGHMQKAPVPNRFGTAAGNALDRREQRRLDQAAGLVPFAVKLHQDLVRRLSEQAVREGVDVGELTARLIGAGLGEAPVARTEAPATKKVASKAGAERRTSEKKATADKPAAKTAAKTAATKKAAEPKAPVNQAPAKKAAATKNDSAKKASPKKASPKKTAAEKPPAQETDAKAPAKKPKAG